MNITKSNYKLQNWKKIGRIFKLFNLPLAICVILTCIWGCSKDSSHPSISKFEEWMSNNGKLKVLSTTAIIDDLVGEIGGDLIDHLPLTYGEMDPHSYELVKGDDEKLSYAGLVFYNGLGLEHGASLRYRLESHSRGIALGNQIQKLDPESILTIGGQTDPHIWMDVSLWAKTIDPIVAALCQQDPNNQEFYKKNGEALKVKMEQVDLEIFETLQSIPSEKRFLVSSHDAFNYFARRYLADSKEENWQERFAAPEGLAPDGQLSGADIQKIINFLSEHQAHIVFPESNISKDSLKKICQACQDTGLTVRISKETLYGDAMGSKDSDANTYLSLMLHNAHAMTKEWSYGE